MRRQEEQVGRVPPHDLDAERALIGAVMVSAAALDVVGDVVRTSDFYSETHRVIYEAVQAIAARSEPVDRLTLSAELRDVGQFDRVGGRRYVLLLHESVPTAANAKHYAEIVRDKALLRKMIDGGSRIVEHAYEEPEDVSAALDSAEHLIFEINNGVGQQGGFAPADELADKVLATVNERHEAGGITPGIPSGFPDLDAYTLGFQPEELVIVGGRTAMGKTSFALSCVRNVACKDGYPVAFFSLEMSKEQLMHRLISMESGIQSQRMAKGDVSPGEWPRLVRARATMGQAPIHIDDTGGVTVAQIRSRLRRLSSKLASRGKPLGMVVVDYVGIMEADRFRRGDNRQQEISQISRGLKIVSREFGVPVMALAQVNRGVEDGHDKRPKLSDLRDSGSLEQDADKVLFVYRDEYYNPKTEDRGIAELIVSKHRNGPTGTARLSWLGKLAQFNSLSRGLPA